MKADVVAVHKEALHAVSRNSNRTKEPSISPSHDHDRDRWNTGPQRVCEAADGLKNILPHRRRRTFADVPGDGDTHLVVSDYPLQSALHIFNGIVGENTAVHIGCRQL